MAGRSHGVRNILGELTPKMETDGTVVFNDVDCFPITPPSPDESLIQLRGYQRKSATYNFDAPDPVFFRSPTHSPEKITPLRNTVSLGLLTPTRSSPRKRTPVKNILDEGPARKMLKLQNMNRSLNTEKNLRALSHTQLVQLLHDVTRVFPAIKETMSSLVPTPDLSPIEDRLYVLQRNVLKSFPRNIWGNQDGSYCFLRVRSHLDAFKKECFEYCRQFMESQHWPSVFEYILIALKLTLGLPNWPTAMQNRVKVSCLKHLSAQCVIAFKKSKIDESSLKEIIERLEELEDNPDVKACVAFARELLKQE